MTAPTPWHGWVWGRGRWQHVCAGGTKEEVFRLLDTLRPVKHNLHHAITRGQVPSWTPGVLEWEVTG